MVKFTAILALYALSMSNHAAALQATALELDGLGSVAQPSVTADPAHGVYVLSWQARLDDGCAALRVAQITTEGELGETHEVARGCDWFVNWADFPSLVIADNGDWVTHWLRKNGSSVYAYEIVLSRSQDRGKTWSEPFVPHSDDTPTEHGFVSMAPLADELVLLMWLDGRRTVDPGARSSDASEHAHGDAMSLRSAVINRAGEISARTEIDEQVCSCCGTDLVRTAAGRHVAVFRDRSNEEIRDIGLISRGSEGWTGQKMLNADGWQIAACPVNGPSLAVNGDQQIAIWPTMGGGEGISVRVRAPNTDSPFVELERGERVLGRVDSAPFGSDWLLSWVGGGDTGASAVRVALVNKALAAQKPLDIAQVPSNRNVGMPRLASLDDHAVLVWTEVSDQPRGADGRAKTRIAGVQIKR